MLVHRQVGQKGFNLGLSRQQVGAATHVVVANEPDNPIGIGTFGVDRVVVKAQDLSDLEYVAATLTPEQR